MKSLFKKIAFLSIMFIAFVGYSNSFLEKPDSKPNLEFSKSESIATSHVASIGDLYTVNTNSLFSKVEHFTINLTTNKDVNKILLLPNENGIEIINKTHKRNNFNALGSSKYFNNTNYLKKLKYFRYSHVNKLSLKYVNNINTGR